MASDRQPLTYKYLNLRTQAGNFLSYTFVWKARFYSSVEPLVQSRFQNNLDLFLELLRVHAPKMKTSGHDLCFMFQNKSASIMH